MSHYEVQPIVFNVPSGPMRGSIIGNDSPSGRLAVVLPGAGYSCKQPLLYYAIRVLLEAGYQVLAIESLYADNEYWRALKSEDEALRYVENDVEALFAQILSRFPSDIDTLMGRSLGTYSIACALERQLIQPRQIIWLCPSLKDKWSVLKSPLARQIVFIGKADPRFEKAAPFLPNDSYIHEDADHAMEVDDPIQSIEILKGVMTYLSRWILNLEVDLSQLERNLTLSPERRVIEHQAALELCDALARAGQRLHEQSQ